MAHLKTRNETRLSSSRVTFDLHLVRNCLPLDIIRRLDSDECQTTSTLECSAPALPAYFQINNLIALSQGNQVVHIHLKLSENVSMNHFAFTKQNLV